MNELIFDAANIDVAPEWKHRPKKSVEERLQIIGRFKRIPLQFFKNDSEAWNYLEDFIQDYTAFNEEREYGKAGLSFSEGRFIAGGSLVRALMGLSETSDIDIWTIGPDEFSAVELAAQDYLAKFGVVTVSYKNKYAPQFKAPGYEVQVCGMPAEYDVIDTLDCFDFYVNQIATDGVDVWIHENALVALTTKRLEFYDESNRVVGSQEKAEERVAKYMKMGFDRPTKVVSAVGRGGIMPHTVSWPWPIVPVQIAIPVPVRPVDEEIPF